MLYLLEIRKMNLVSVGTVAFDAVETPFGKTDKIMEVLVRTFLYRHLILIQILG